LSDTETRQISTPGDPAAIATAAPAPARKTPGPKPKAEREAAATAAASTGDDDLADYDSDDLPPDPAASRMVSMADVQTMLDRQAAEFRRQMAQAIHAAKSSQDPETAARLAAERIAQEKLPTTEAARVMCESAVSQGQRPRAILTQDGWYVHPAMGRTKANDLDKGIL
jgi:hypothetical protein